MNDWRLLQRFVGTDSQAAFGELVRRYTGLVYCTCQRELQDASLAEEAAQAVFLILARKAPSFRNQTTLSSWLFQTAVFTAKNLRRQEQRRQRHEQEAASQMTQTGSNTPHGWEEAEPLLNAALNSLSKTEQALIIERFWEDQALTEIGSALSISEDAARMRVNRALEKLRRYFAARNIILPASALAALLPQAVHPAPAHCAEAILRLLPLPVPTATSTSAHLLAQGVLATMNVKRLKLQLGAAVLVAALSIGTVGAVRMNSQAKARTVAAEKQADSDRALAVLDQMDAAYATMKSFRCEVTSRQDITGEAQDATYEFERPNKVRFHRATLIGTDGSGQALAVSDGTRLFVTCTEQTGLADRYYKGDAGNSVDNFADFGGLPNWGTAAFAGMPGVAVGGKPWQDQDISLSAPKYSLGQPVVMPVPGDKPVAVDVVIVRRHGDAANARRHNVTLVEIVKDDPQVLTYYIGQSDHLLYKMTVAYMYSPTEWNTRTETIYAMEINSKINPADFVFTPPPGSHEVSSTSDLFPSGKM